MPITNYYDMLKTKREFEQEAEQYKLNKQLAQAKIKEAEMGNLGPASVQEWKYFQQMSPQDKAAYIEMKRAPQALNLGGSYGIRSPFGGIGESYTVTPKPSEMPGFEAEVESARKQAALQADAEAEAKKGVGKANKMISVANEAKQLLPSASGGYGGAILSGAKGALNISDETTQANARLKQLSGWLVANVPRMEGPQSNFDVQNYEKMAGDVGNILLPIGDRMAALEGLLSLQEKYSSLNKDIYQQNSMMPPPLPMGGYTNDLGDMSAPPSSPQVSDRASVDESIFNAKKAVRNGADREAVRQRLLEAGINPSLAGL